MTSPMALPRSQATSASRCWFLHPAERQKKLAAGIVHGHLAMMSIIGMSFQGGFGFKVLGSAPCREKEACCGIANGRLAIMTIIGMFWVGRLGPVH